MGKVYIEDGNGNLILQPEGSSGGSAGGDAGGGSGALPAITSVPPANAGDVGQDGQVEYAASAGVAVGTSFELRDGAQERTLRWYGHPGQFWKRNSWAIFDESGVKVAGGDNVTVVGTLGFALDISGVMGTLPAGRYTGVLMPDAGGQMTTQLKQS